MTSYEGKYDKFKISLSLGSDKLYISALDEVTYDFYDLDITNMIFNNDNIKLSQLFTIIKEGFQQANQNNKISITLCNKFVKINVIFESTYFSLNNTFELVKQLTETSSTKELKKELFELRKSYELIKKEIHQKSLDNISKIDLYRQDINRSISTLETKQDSVNKHDLLKKDILFLKKDIKENSIIPIVNIKIDENQVETTYKWFLDWLKTQINLNPSFGEMFTQKIIPNTSMGTGGHTPINNLGWNNLIIIGQNSQTNQLYTQMCPEKSLYYYLRKRNIDIWRDHANNMYWMYVI
jgi:hypothetical protein